jgi:hypothetical protein
VRDQPDDDKLMNAVLLQLRIKVHVVIGERAAAQMRRARGY